MSKAARLPDHLRGTLRFDEPMAAHVSWRAGGPAARLYVPADVDDLAQFFASIRWDEPLLAVGLGSNLLVRDGGFDGTVVLLNAVLAELTFDGETLYAEAGVSCPKVARLAASEDRVGAEFLAGIPGTVGGALAMNAGCHGSQTWDIVARVLTLDRQGHRHQRSAADFAIGYRHVGSRVACDELFLGAWFRLEAGDGEAARQRSRELLEKRQATQPLQLPNAGSVFRNPPNDHAARLIEAAGLKGLQIGGARVSEQHANFIVNPDRQATAADIEALIDRVQATVREKFAVELVREVRIVGERL